MKQIFVTLFLLTIFAFAVKAQTTIAQQDFDGATPTWSYSSDVAFFDNGWDGDGYFGIIDIATATQFINSDFSSNILGVNDLDDEGDNGTAGDATITFGTVSISGYTNTSISFDYETIAFESASDYIKYEVFIDGTGQGEVTLPFEGEGKIIVDVSSANNNVGLNIIIKQNGASDYGGLDNFKIEGTATGSPAISVNPPTLTDFEYVEGSGPSTSQSYDLSGSNLTPADDNLTVTGSTNYEVSTDNTNFSGSVTVAYTGGTLNDTPIYVRLKSGLTNGDYNNETITNTGGGASQTDVTVSGTVYKTEPTNHVTDFVSALGTPTHSSIDITWTDATGGTVPDGYLIKGSSVGFGDITDPVDGTPEADGGLVLNVTQGTQTATFNGLTESTTYYFQIYPYTNSGTNINYKTDGSVPQTSSTTDAAPVLPDLVINEVLADPNSTTGDANGDGNVNTTDDEFVELINNEASSLDISSWTLSDGIGLRHTFPASTIIPAGESIVIFGGGTPTNIPGISQVASSNALGLNNGGDVILIEMSDGTDVVSYTYGSEGGNDQSLARDPDITGAFVLHSTIATNSVDFSPGRDNTDNSPLPVELTSFSASVSGSSVTLNWETATEVDNYGFEIERLQNSKIEKLQNWEKVGFVQGSGNSNSPKSYSFVDDDVEETGTYSYRLKQVGNDGSFEYSKTIEVSFAVPMEYSLQQNYPNPFNPATTIKFTIPKAGMVKLSVYNILGEEVAELLNGMKEAGVYNINFDAASLNSGIYFYKIQTEDFVKTMKMLLMK